MTREYNSKGYIYKIENKLHGMVYIGLTTRNPIQRWLEHSTGSVDGTTKDLTKDIVKLGIENFSFEILDTVDDVGYGLDNLRELEKYYITKYHSYDNGYNRTVQHSSVGSHNENIERIKGAPIYDLIAMRDKYITKELFNPASKNYKLNTDVFDNKDIWFKLGRKYYSTSDAESIFNLVDDKFYRYLDNGVVFIEEAMPHSSNGSNFSYKITTIDGTEFNLEFLDFVPNEETIDVSFFPSLLLNIIKEKEA